MHTHAVAMRASCVAVALALTVACAKKEPIPQAAAVATVADVSLGRAVNSAQQVVASTDTFAPMDTIFVAVKTENTPAGTRVLARWVFTEGGTEQIVSERELTTTQAGTGYTSFFIANPGPWPAGSYQVRIGLNGEIKENKTFSVRG